MGFKINCIGYLIIMETTPILPLERLLTPATFTRPLGAGPLWGCIILGARAHGSQPQCERWHLQKLFAVNVLLQGRGEFTDSSGRLHALHPGTLYQRLGVGGKARVRLDPKADCVEFFIITDRNTFRGLKVLRIIPELEILSGGPPLLLTQDYLAFRDLCLLPHEDISRRMLLARLTTFLSGLYDRALRQRTDDYWDRIVATAEYHLENDLASRLHLPDLARELHVTYPSFRRAFSRLKGVSPADYRIRRRIEAACRLLAEHPVKEVAVRLGYCDPFTFSSQFRKFTGTSPSSFRNELRQGAAR
jgi:AraC-like DNA-binding protein